MPDWKTEVQSRLASVHLAPPREAEIIEELSQHLEDRWRELIAAGIDPNASRQQALADFSASNVLARYMAPLRQSHWMDPARPPSRRWFLFGGMRTDLRDAVRSLRAAPSFTLVALLLLAFGIGSTTAIFSLVDAVVLRGLPFADPDRIVAVGERRSGPGGKPGAVGPVTIGIGAADPRALLSVQPQNYLDWVSQQHAFEALAAIADGDYTLVAPGSGPEAVAVQRVTASFFDVLRVQPARGRVFTADHEVAGGDRVIVLSDAFWHRRFDGNPSIVGQAVTLDGSAHEVIGVMPAAFTYPVGASKSTDLWVPYVVPETERVRGQMHALYLQSIGRLRPDVSVQQANDHMRQLAAAIERANPDWNRGTSAGVRPLRDHLVGANVRSWMLMLLAAVGLVLLIACVNVANLLIARATTRAREVAVRAALGAGRWRLIRQLLAESLVLSACGSALGIALAWWAIQMLRNAMPMEIPRVATVGLDLRVLAAACGLAFLTGMVCGVLPAFQSSKPDLTNALHHGDRTGRAGRLGLGLRNVLVVAELAVAVVLVVGSALFIGSFIRVMRLDPGFNPDGVLTVQIYQRGVPGEPRADLSGPLTEVDQVLAQVPNVVAASVSSPGLPLRPNFWINDFAVRNRVIERNRGVSIKIVTPGYHKALGISLDRGRLFNEADTAASAKVVIINKALERNYLPGSDPIGQTAVVNGADRTIIGIVADARQQKFEVAATPEVYLPLAQGGPISSGYLAIRTTGDPSQLVPAVRSEVLRFLPTMPLRLVATMDELVAAQTAQRRLTMLMLGLFGLLGLVIAAIGVYGVMAYLVTRRTREIGVRMALGATRAEVVWMVVTRGALLVGTGLAVGATGAWYLSKTAQAFLFGLEAHDPRVFAAAVGTLAVAALIASVIPARRAASVDPTVALRSE